MRMTVTKVKPVVVKHVLSNQVMSIYDPQVITYYSCRLTLNTATRKERHYLKLTLHTGRRLTALSTLVRPTIIKNQLRRIKFCLASCEKVCRSLHTFMRTKVQITRQKRIQI